MGATQKSKRKITNDPMVPLLGVYTLGTLSQHTTEIPSHPCLCNTMRNSQVIKSVTFSMTIEHINIMRYMYTK